MNSHRIGDNRKLEAKRIRSPQWFDAGFGLRVFAALTKRCGSNGWEDGVFHQNGINDGHWIVLHNAAGRRLRDILCLYSSRDEFLDDCP